MTDFEYKYCNVCNKDVHIDDFYKRPNGKPLGAKCRNCRLMLNRQSSMNQDTRDRRLIRQRNYAIENSVEIKKNSIRYYESIKGRAATLFKGVKDRCSKYSEELDFDVYFLEDLLLKGKCSITNIEFDLKTKGDSRKNPFAPSVDRINCRIGYIKSNVRLVLWQINLMKGELSDSQLLEMCKRVIENESRLDL